MSPASRVRRRQYAHECERETRREGGGRGRTLDLDLTGKVVVVEDLHRDLLLARVLLLKGRVGDGDVVLEVLAREDALVAHAEVGAAQEHPVGDRGRDARDDKEEDVGGAERDEGDKAAQDVGDEEDGGRELEVGEGAVAVDGEGGVGDGGAARHLEADLGVERGGPASINESE